MYRAKEIYKYYMRHMRSWPGKAAKTDGLKSTCGGQEDSLNIGFMLHTVDKTAE